MLVRRSTCTVRVIKVAPRVTFMQCMIHPFALSCLVNYSEVAKMVSHVKWNAINSRSFELLYEDFDTDQCASVS